VLDLARTLYLVVKQALREPRVRRSDPWVTASKLCARKRPRLLPVRDHAVRQMLGIRPPYDHRLDWKIYRELVRDDEIADLLLAATATARTPSGTPVQISDPPLRILDVALWTKAIGLHGANT
jgi:hypothetical protein